MEEEQIKVFADSLWDYLLEKKLKQYLSDSVCYYMASVVEPASDGFITVQRPFDNPVTLPCGANAENLAVGDACAVLVFGDFSNQIVIGNVAELTGKIKITDATETTLNGVLAGNGETVEAIPVDSVPTAGSTNLVTSDGTANAIAAVKGLAQSEVIPSNADLDDYTTPGVYSCGSTTTAATLTNCPSASSPFTLTVTDKMVSGASPKRVIQLFVSGNRIFSRGLLSTGWSAWVDYYTISGGTPTTLSGVLSGNGSTVSVMPVDSVPTAGSQNLVTSDGTADAIAKQTPKPLGGFSTLDVLSTLLDTEVNAMANNRAELVFVTANATIYPFVNTYTYRGQLIRSSAGYANIILSPTGPSARPVYCKRSQAQGWKFEPIATDADIVNPNLVDNWYFIGGGSQQGGNQFPINEQGNTSYTLGTSNTFSVNRWLSTNGTITVASDHINYTSQASLASYKRFIQPTGVTIPSGTTVTISMLAKVNSVGGTVYMRLGNAYASYAAYGLTISAATTDYELFTHTVKTDRDIAASFDILVNNTAESAIDIDIKAVKMELSDSQTLAHQENGVWVLNEIPNYEEQLIRCKTSIAVSGDLYANDSVVFESRLCRENLLDNWLFVGGGSQLGEGIFPINERGLTSYSRAYCIDRWRTVDSSSSGVTIAVQADGVKITHTTTTRNWIIYQNCLVPDPVGKTFTASILVKEVSGTRSRLHIAFLDASGTQLSAPSSSYVTAAGLYQITAVAPANTVKLRVGLYPGSAPTVGDYVLLTAAKVELSDSQTLAHEASGAWVLNALPNYEEQLIRCKSSTADSIDTYASDEVMFQSMLHFERPHWTMTDGKVFKITFPAYYRGIIYTFGSSVAAKSEIMVSSTSGATVSYASVLAGSGMSVAASGATLTLTNTTASTYIYVFIDTFSDVQPTWEEVTT